MPDGGLKTAATWIKEKAQPRMDVPAAPRLSVVEPLNQHPCLRRESAAGISLSLGSVERIAQGLGIQPSYLAFLSLKTVIVYWPFPPPAESFKSTRACPVQRTRLSSDPDQRTQSPKPPGMVTLSSSLSYDLIDVEYLPNGARELEAENHEDRPAQTSFVLLPLCRRRFLPSRQLRCCASG